MKEIIDLRTNVMTLFVLLTIFVGCLYLLFGCTYSMNMVHTQGSASDVVDDTQSPTADIKPIITIPASVL